MFEKDAFRDRERAMEDEFFHRVDEQLLEELRKSAEREKSREALASTTGLSDSELLDTLLEAGFQVTTLSAIMLVPATFVAWADGQVDPAERETILKAAAKRGIEAESPAGKLLQSWLSRKPPKSLWETWKQYAQAVGESLPAKAASTLRQEVHSLATAVAEAAGGILGIGKVSSQERQVLDQIKQAWEAGAGS